ncbi:MAG: ParB/RepB/Spo0J family partition protein [Pseudomonadota bacterium]
MQLTHINLFDLKPAKVNVRKRGGKDVEDLVPSIRSIGLIQPLLVRPNCEGYEVIAGQRRYHALMHLAEDCTAEPVPCIVMDEGDDAAAIEASLAENVARLPMDEIDQYQAFAALVTQGLDIADIANKFGVTERLVTKRLAIANIIGPILTLYRKDEIGPETLRILTMATKTQQKKWLELWKSDEGAPQGHRLKCWLFGGTQISTEAALFDVADSGLVVIGDLFGDDCYFADSQAFWPLQSQAIAEARDAYLADGWVDVIVLEIGEHFPSYDYVDTPKENGGKVYVHIAHNGEVTFYEGQLSRQEARARDKARASGDEVKTTDRPELTKAMQRYLDLHRHAAVRCDLLDNPGIALRLAVSQAIAGSELWSVSAEAQKAPSEAITESLADNAAEESFREERAKVAELLGIETNATFVPRQDDWSVSRDLHGIFAKLVTLTDDDVMRVLAFVVAETLAAGTPMVDALGIMLGTDMSKSWQPDETFFDLLRDKEAINAMLREIGGKRVADSNVTETAKTQKGIIHDYLSGTREGGKQDWHPRYAAFPMKAYTKRSGIAAIDNWKAVKKNHHA